MLFKDSCPYCGKSIEIDPLSPLQPEFKDSQEKLKYNKKRFELQKRGKDCFVCPACGQELVIFSGKLFKGAEFSEDLYNKVFCSFCDKEVNFDKCYKEIKGTAVGYTFYCKDCGKKNLIRWLVLVIVITIIALIIIYVSRNPLKPHFPSRT